MKRRQGRAAAAPGHGGVLLTGSPWLAYSTRFFLFDSDLRQVEEELSCTHTPLVQAPECHLLLLVGALFVDVCPYGAVYNMSLCEVFA